MSEAGESGARPLSPASQERLAALTAQITACGDKVRAIKAEGGDASAAVAELLSLKAQASELDPSLVTQGKKKKGKGAPSAEDAEKARIKKAEAQKAATARAEAKIAKQKAAAERRAAKEKAGKIKVKEREVPWVDQTPAGEKKVMSPEMQKEYHPTSVEAAWYAWWEKSGYFTASSDEPVPESERFVMVIPPPNVTGALHIGHALTNSIEDAITRYHRMCGKVALWVPGCDHAGIATQTVVEKKIMARDGKTRHDLGREAFVSEVWNWKDDYGARIYNQLRLLGSSLDWTRESFTMSDKLSRAVTEAFVRMYDNGIVYRARRLVNWSPKLNSAISDIEVDYITLEGKTRRKVPGHKGEYDFGVMIEFAYKVDGSETDEELVVATTRIETMLGDTAVAVHPDDPRYDHLHGKFLVHPFVDRKIPIITDAQLVDMSFGTGAVKITPAHDPNDYEAGLRNGLEEITVLCDDGSMNHNAGKFQGMMRFDARVAVVEALRELGLYRGEKPNPMRLGLCSRSGDVVEPMLKPQWWVDCKDIAAQAAQAVRGGDLKLVPDFHEATWFNWLDNSRDWCISRQLWWGHRIPAYLARVEGCPEPDPNDGSNWFVGRTEEEALQRATEALCGDGKKAPAGAKVTLSQDPDVLDTWFSSGLFPFSVFGWPDEADPDLAAFFPTSLLETGSDILFFWVARMVMMSLHLTGKLPFNTVFLHAMVRDAHGRKMSKTLGNVIDPLDVISGITLEQLHAKLDASTNIAPDELERAKIGQTADYPEGIAECGADALRYALCSYASQGRSINLDIQKVISCRAFCNKLWNATRFALGNLGEGYTAQAQPETDLSKLAAADVWILARASGAARAARAAFEAYDFGTATGVTYAFFLNDICDVYLEMVKGTMRGEDGPAKTASRGVLYTVLDIGLRLLHPFMPFVTEELWQRLGRREGDDTASIMISRYPSPVDEWDSPEAEASMTFVMSAITAIRSLRAANKLTTQRPPVFLSVTEPAEGGEGEPASVLIRWLERQADDIAIVSNSGSVACFAEGSGNPDAGCAIQVVSDRLTVYVGLKGLINVDEEIEKLTKRLEQLQKSSEALETRMGTDNYLKVPEKVREGDKVKLDAMKQEIVSVAKGIEEFKSMA